MAMPRQRWRYALTAAGLALGAPGGLLLLRGALAGTLRPDWAADELARDSWLYLYLFSSTTLVFALFGYTLGLAAERLSRLSTSDPLTGLLNARVFAERLELECARAARYGGPLSLLFIDVDGLKQLNDDQGHAVGDAALRAVASAVRSCSRASDSASRWGGDEFAVIAPGTELASAARMAERIRALSAQAAATTASVGVAGWSPGCSAAALRQAADAALYEAKRAGRDRVCACACGQPGAGA
jgi:diguanylate cyclase (GGDEF)-like protein